MRLSALVVSLTFGAVVSLGAQPAALKIVVIEGEDAVNVIQQKTAVRPLVEVRDRNNLPVPGALVTFTIGGGQNAAFAGGLQTLTVTTNAAGQAAAAGLSPLSTGAFQIQVQAAFQGQVATAAITQTNFATAAAAAQAGNASGAASGAGAGAGGGGGISGTTIGIAGAAVAGGAVVATKALGGDDSGDGSSGGSGETTFTGPVSAQFDMSTITASSTGSTTCISTRAINGTLVIKLTQQGGATISGTAQTSGSLAEIAVTQSQFCSPLTGGLGFGWNGPVTGTASNVVFSAQSSFTGSTPNGQGSVTSNTSVNFVGVVAGGVMTGTLTYTDTTAGTALNSGISSTINGRGSVTINVTLR